MSDISFLRQYRSVWCIDIDALRMYLKEGHGVNCGPELPDDRRLEPGSIDELASLLSGKDHADSQELAGLPQFEDLQRRWHEKCIIDSKFAMYAPDKFERVRNAAPDDVRKQLVLLHAYYCTPVHKIFGSYSWKQIVIPAGLRPPEGRNEDASDWELFRLMKFMDAANSIIPEDKRDRVGFQVEHFVLRVLAFDELCTPRFSRAQIKEVLENRELLALYCVPRKWLLARHLGMSLEEVERRIMELHPQ